MTNTSWRDDRNGGKKFGGGARRWFRRKVFATLFSTDASTTELKGPDRCIWSRDQANGLVGWFDLRWSDFVEWDDDNEWKGIGFANGSWVFLKTNVLKHVEGALVAWNRDTDARRFTTLDSWLKADILGHLSYDGDSGGMGRVGAAVKAKLRDRALRRQKRRTCACGTEFEADRKTARRCDRCREIARREKEQARGARKR